MDGYTHSTFLWHTHAQHIIHAYRYAYAYAYTYTNTYTNTYTHTYTHTHILYAFPKRDNWRGMFRKWSDDHQSPCLPICLFFHTMDMLWEKFQWILPLYIKPIAFQSKASVDCSVTTAAFIDFCPKKLNVFSQHIGAKTNEYLNSAEQIHSNWNVDLVSVLITSWDIT